MNRLPSGNQALFKFNQSHESVFFFCFVLFFFSFLKERVETFVFPLDQFLTSYSNYFKPLSLFFPLPGGLKFWYLPWPFSNFKTESTRTFKGSFKIASYLQVWYMRFDTVVIPELIGGDTNLQSLAFLLNIFAVRQALLERFIRLRFEKTWRIKR